MLPLPQRVAVGSSSPHCAQDGLAAEHKGGISGSSPRDGDDMDPFPFSSSRFSTSSRAPYQRRTSLPLPHAALPFLHKTEVFLYPVVGIIMLLLLSIILVPFGFNLNATLIVARLYFVES